MEARSQKAKMKATDVFFCKFLNKDVTVANCVDDYVTANSLSIKHSPCFKCPQGIKVRQEFANS